MSTPQSPRRRRIAGESKPGGAAPPAQTPRVKVPKVKAPKVKAPKVKAPNVTKPPKVEAPKTQEATVSAPPVSVPPAAAPSTATAEVTEPRASRLRIRPVSGRLATLMVLTVAALAFGAVFGIRGFNQWRDDNGVLEAHERAASTAASAGETIFTYQYNKLGVHLRDSKATMTTSFAKKFDSIAPALQDLAPQRKIQVKATVRDAAAIECGDQCSSDKATVLVYIDQARVADGADKPTVFGNRIELMMVKQDGRWLVNNIKAL